MSICYSHLGISLTICQCASCFTCLLVLQLVCCPDCQMDKAWDHGHITPYSSRLGIVGICSHDLCWFVVLQRSCCLDCFDDLTQRDVTSVQPCVRQVVVSELHAWWLVIHAAGKQVAVRFTDVGSSAYASIRKHACCWLTKHITSHHASASKTQFDSAVVARTHAHQRCGQSLKRRHARHSSCPFAGFPGSLCRASNSTKVPQLHQHHS